MSDTPRLDMPEISVSQGSKEVTHNEALRILDCLVQPTVISMTLTAPPGSPADGDTYIPLATATGAWAGHENEIAYYQVNTWVFIVPKNGWDVFCEEDSLSYRYTTASPASWVLIEAGGGASTFLELTDVDQNGGNYTGLAYHSPHVASTELGMVWGTQAYDIHVEFVGRPGPSQKMLRMYVTRDIRFYGEFSQSAGNVDVAATADTTFSIQESTVEIGTAYVLAGQDFFRFQTPGTPAFIDVDAGSFLEIVAPATPDTTLATGYFTLYCWRRFTEE